MFIAEWASGVPGMRRIRAAERLLSAGNQTQKIFINEVKGTERQMVAGDYPQRFPNLSTRVGSPDIRVLPCLARTFCSKGCQELHESQIHAARLSDADFAGMFGLPTPPAMICRLPRSRIRV